MASDKTNALRLLDKANISHKTHSYTVDEKDLSATHLCEMLGIDFSKVYKSIVVETSNKMYAMGLVSANSEIDLKKMAKAVGAKSCTLLPMKELQNVTGYIRGGCTPIGLKKPLPIIIDILATEQDSIYISAGKRGLQIELSPNDLISFVEAKAQDIRK